MNAFLLSYLKSDINPNKNKFYKMDINSTLTETVESISNNNNLFSFTISYTWLAIILGTVVLYSIYYYHFREA